MKPATGGYTLLEVLLFLAVSSVLLAISNVVLQGQSSRTEFTASMNDVTSKMQQWIDQVKNGYSASTASSSAAIGNYNCTLDGSGNPQLVSPGAAVKGNGVGTNLDCVFLGRAIMINDKFGSGPKDLTDKIYAYTVLGRRTYNDGTGQVLVTTLKNSNAAAAVFPVNSAPPSINLTESYRIPNGTKVRRVWTDNINQTKNLAGFYNDPSSASNSIVSVQYPFSGNVNPTAWSTNAWDIPKCINLNLNSQGCRNNVSTPDNLWKMSTWNICFESTRDDERALLQIISPNGDGGAPVVKLQMGKASVCNGG